MTFYYLRKPVTVDPVQLTKNPDEVGQPIRATAVIPEWHPTMDYFSNFLDRFKVERNIIEKFLGKLAC